MNQADTYAEIVASRSSYVSQQEFKAQIKTSYLEGMKIGLQMAANRIEGAAKHNRLWGFAAEQIPLILSQTIRDIVIDLGESDVE